MYRTNSTQEEKKLYHCRACFCLPRRPVSEAASGPQGLDPGPRAGVGVTGPRSCVQLQSYRGGQLTNQSGIKLTESYG